MNGHELRTERKKNNIKKMALKLFDKFGVNKVTMDEIAFNANVSKVTIYKYFNSKEDLYNEVIKMVYTEKFLEIEAVVHSDKSFIEKLKFIILSKVQSTKTAQGAFFQEIVNMNHEVKSFIDEHFEDSMKGLLAIFFDQGRNEGYIRDDISNEVLTLYLDVFQTGLNGKMEEIMEISQDNITLEHMIDLYFFGIISKRK